MQIYASMGKYEAVKFIGIFDGSAWSSKCGSGKCLLMCQRLRDMAVYDSSLHETANRYLFKSNAFHMRFCQELYVLQILHCCT